MEKGILEELSKVLKRHNKKVVDWSMNRGYSVDDEGNKIPDREITLRLVLICPLEVIGDGETDQIEK